MTTEVSKRAAVRATHLEALCVELRDFLMRAKQANDEEIHSYPTPIPRCDAQFNSLYEERSRLSGFLARASALLPPGDDANALIDTLVDFSESPPITGDASEQALRMRIKTELARRWP